MSDAKAKPRVVAIIQARMGSTRLPGKVMRAIAGKPLLWHVIHRLKQCKTLDHIAIATSTAAHDDPIAEFAGQHGIDIARGSEHNVLARYILAAWQTNAEIIVRVSADAPFLDPAFIDHLVEHLIEQEGDYVTLVPGAQCAHEGVDPFSRRALEKLAREAAHEHVAREHVTGYFKVNPDFVRIVHAPGFDALAKEPARLTVDTPDDLAFAEAVHARLQAKAGEASLEDLLWLIEREPGLKKINAHVRQKPIDRQGSVALLRCDGGGAFGYGHVRRTIMLARNLRDREGFGIVVALNGDDNAAEMLRHAGFETFRLPARAPGASLMEIVRDQTPGIVVCDCREGLTRDELARIGETVPIVAVIDDASERRFAATHAYYPPVAGARALGWTGPGPSVNIGWEWAVIGFDPALCARDKVPNHRLRVAVSMGGSDPFGHTRMVARALAKISAPFYARVLIGPSFSHPDALVREIDALAPNITAVTGADAAAEFAAADVAVAAFGVTAYELAALGVPALYVGLFPDHIDSAHAFEHMGAGTMLGLGGALNVDTVAKAVWNLLRDADRRDRMRKAGLAAIDGRGAERIAADLAQALEKKRATDLKAAS